MSTTETLERLLVRAAEPESPPPADRTPPEWERRAHAEAEESRHAPPKL